MWYAVLLQSLFLMGFIFISYFLWRKNQILFSLHDELVQRCQHLLTADNHLANQNQKLSLKLNQLEELISEIRDDRASESDYQSISKKIKYGYQFSQEELTHLSKSEIELIQLLYQAVKMT